MSLLALSIVGLIAVLSLRDGFSGDQTLFLIYSKAVGSGAVFYRDVWDIKQPAIIVFYLIAGKFFGFTEVGIHSFELIYWLGFGLFLAIGLRSYFSNSLFAALTPLFTIGIYYTVTGSIQLTQVEGLVGVPLFLSLWFCQKILESPDKKWFLFLSGLCGGIVLTFKLMFIAILFAFWLCLLAYCRFLFPKTDAKQILISAGLICFGLMIPAASVVIYFAANDALGDLWYTTFVYPYNAFRTISGMENRTQVLNNGLEWFFKSYFPVISLSLMFLLFNLKTLFGVWRQKKKFVPRGESFLSAGLFVWVWAGFAVILIQRLSWWDYHYSLLLIPLGILAVKCVERFFEEINTGVKHRRKTPAYLLLTLMIVLLFVPTWRRLAHKIVQASRTETVKIGNREFVVTGDSAEDYKSISADTAFLTKENLPVSMFVISNPLYYYLSDLTPVFASNGAMSDMFTASEWKRLDHEMSKELPTYIFIETRFIKPITEANPSFINTLDQNYFVHSTGGRGSFYKLKN